MVCVQRSYPFQAFLWTATSGILALPTLGGQNSAAQAINGKSQIAGFSDVSQTVTHAVLWTAPNQIQDLGTRGGNYATAQSMNDLGQVVGWSTLQSSMLDPALLCQGLQRRLNE